MGKQIDKNDFWFIQKNPITKVGVFPYLGKQISQDCEPNKIYYVLRPKEELFRKETLDSLKLLPLVNEHTMLGKDFTPAEEKGVEGILGEQVVHDTDTIYTDIKIFSEDMKDKISNGKKELSLGYFCTYDKQEGTYNGQRYDYVQKNIIGNHLALVDKGRMGSGVRVYDSAIEVGKSFAMDSVAIDDDKKTEWITVKGTHIPVKEGESKGEVVKNFIESKKDSGNKVEGKKESKVERAYKKLSGQGLKGEALEQAIYEKHGWEGVEELRKIEKGNNKEEKHKSGLNSQKVKRFRELLNKKDTESIEKEFGKKIWSENAIEQLKSSLFLKYDKGSKDPNLPEFEYLKDDIEKSEDMDIEKMEYKKNNEEKKEMADKKKQVEAKDEDKRKLIDEIGGILKDKVSEEDWRTIVGKIEKVAYNASEAGKGTDEDVEKKEDKEDVEEKEDKKPAKDKCGKDEDKKEDKKEGEDEEENEEEKKKEIIKEFAKKEKLAKEVEDSIGTFDHSEMTELEVAQYACDKLELGAEKGQEIATLKGFLKGVAKQKVAVKMKAEDSAYDVVDTSFDSYIKNAKK